MFRLQWDKLVLLFLLINLWPLGQPGAIYAVEEAEESQSDKLLERLEQLEQSNQELQQRLAELEKDLENQEAEEADIVAGEFVKSYRVYGFMQPGYLAIEPQDTASIFNDFPKYDIGPVHLYFDFLFARFWRALVELAFAPSPRSDRGLADQSFFRFEDDQTIRKETNSVGLERAWVSYTFYPWLELQIGTFIPPHGIYKVDHAAYVLPTARVPIETSFPNKLTGIQLLGEWDFKNFFLNYHVYTANGPSTELDPNLAERRAAGSERDLDYDKALGGKLRVNLKTTRLVQQAFVGYGLYQALKTLRTSTAPDLREAGLQKEILEKRLGTEALLKLGWEDWQWEMQGEIVNHIDSGRKRNGGNPPEFVAVQTNDYQNYVYSGVRWKNSAVYLSREVFIGDFVKNFRAIVDVVGVRQHFTSSVVLKVEKAQVRTPSRKRVGEIRVGDLIEMDVFWTVLAIGF